MRSNAHGLPPSASSHCAETPKAGTTKRNRSPHELRALAGAAALYGMGCSYRALRAPLPDKRSGQSLCGPGGRGAPRSAERSTTSPMPRFLAHGAAPRSHEFRRAAVRARRAPEARARHAAAAPGRVARARCRRRSHVSLTHRRRVARNSRPSCTSRISRRSTKLALENEGVHALCTPCTSPPAILFWTPILAVAPAPHAPSHPVRLLALFLAIPMSGVPRVCVFYVTNHSLYPRTRHGRARCTIRERGRGDVARRRDADPDRTPSGSRRLGSARTAFRGDRGRRPMIGVTFAVLLAQLPPVAQSPPPAPRRPTCEAGLPIYSVARRATAPICAAARTHRRYAASAPPTSISGSAPAECPPQFPGSKSAIAGHSWRSPRSTRSETTSASVQPGGPPIPVVFDGDDPPRERNCFEKSARTVMGSTRRARRSVTGSGLRTCGARRRFKSPKPSGSVHGRCRFSERASYRIAISTTSLGTFRIDARAPVRGPSAAYERPGSRRSSTAGSRRAASRSLRPLLVAVVARNRKEASS